MSQRDYEGTELDLFAHAKNWKAYWSALLKASVRGRVLDVGAGCGATIESLHALVAAQWTALEPDPDLAARIQDLVAARRIPADTQVRVGGTSDLGDAEYFDTIMYIDVLEHIADDRTELTRAARHLAPGGCLLVLAPAHQWLFSPFDAAIGHCRRYTINGLRAVLPVGLVVEKLCYLDSVGLLASLANKMILRSAHPTLAQISLWDRWMIPLSRLLDPMSFGKIGKSVILIARWSGPDTVARH